MTIKTDVQNQTRLTRGKQVSTVDSSDYTNSPQNTTSTKRDDTGSQRQRCSRATVARTNSAIISISVSGKLARQLSKSLESQLTESISEHEISINRTAKYEQKIAELKEELESLKQLIEQLDQAEHETEEVEVEKLE
ncbi:hypothetical protein QUB10_12620 [Microcoleus sp. B5-D4]|uniref:hypothetical protein n=1 Tax=unclassified Microcoleus TaxID=2642155 RepID=UPI002FD2DC05